MTTKTKKYLYGGLIILGGIVVIVWMRNYLVAKGVISASPTNAATDPLGVGTLQLQSWFTTSINAQPGTTAFPSQLQ